MSANIVTTPNLYNTYPYIYQAPTLFNPPSNDLAGNRALLESNLVGGNRKRKHRKPSYKRVGGGGKTKHSKKSKKNITRCRRTMRSKSLYHFE